MSRTISRRKARAFAYFSGGRNTEEPFNRSPLPAAYKEKRIARAYVRRLSRLSRTAFASSKPWRCQSSPGTCPPFA